MKQTLACLAIGMGWYPENPGNGLDRVYYALYKNLHHASVSVSGSVAGSPAVAEQSAGKIKAFESDKAPLVRRLLKQRALVKQEFDKRSIDLVASHFALYTFPVLGLIQDRPLVVHFHGPWADESRVEGDNDSSYKFKKYIERRVYNQADRFIVLSTAFHDVLVKDFGIDPSIIRIVPGGADIDRFDTGLDIKAARQKLGWKSEGTIIVSVRRLARRMGLENLVIAISMLVGDFPDLYLKIAGKGPIEEELKTLITQLGIEKHVEMLGYVAEEDLPAAYAAANLSVVPTLKLEGFGLITVESLAAGTPCLVTPVGGLPEVVSQLSSSLVLPDTDVECLVRRLRDILSGGVDIPDAKTCRDFARENYDWKAVAMKTRAVYDEVV